MSHFFETLKIENGIILNLEQHNIRLNRTIRDNFHQKSALNLLNFIKIPDKHTYRCKVIYNQKIQSVDFLPYKERVFQSFKLMHSTIEYPYKSVNRDSINALYAQKGLCDDILIIKEGLLTDTSIANIAVFAGCRWVTPKKPLLFGTQRARLLQNKLIIEKDIKIEDMKYIDRFAIINALIGFQEVKDVKFQD